MEVLRGTNMTTTKIAPKITKLLTTAGAALFLTAIVVFTLYPVIYSLLGSLKTNMELTGGGGLLPRQLMFSNYYDAFIRSDFLLYGFNSVLISAGCMVLALLTTSLMGFVLARYQFTGKRMVLGLYVGLMFVSLGAVSIYPIFELLNSLGMTKNLSGLILTLTGGQAANVLLVMGYVRSVPTELDEAAVIDGCGPLRIYWSVILPLIRPILGIVALFSFRAAWNDYITTMILTIPMPDLMTITVAVVQLKYATNAATEWHLMLAGASVAIIPILILYAFTSKQFISGLTAGSVKG